jgi:hypothetical protein
MFTGDIPAILTAIGPIPVQIMWPEQTPQPVVSMRNARDAAITNNMAIVSANDGSITVFPSNPAHPLLDIFGFFAPGTVWGVPPSAVVSTI